MMLRRSVRRLAVSRKAWTLSISSHGLAGHLIWLAVEVSDCHSAKLKGSASVRVFLLTTRHAYETDVDVSISKGDR